MRNLKIQRTCHISGLKDLTGTTNTSISTDTDTGRVIIATATAILALDPQTQQVTHSQSLLSESAIPEEGQGYVVGVQYLADQSGACVACSNGNLTLWFLDTNQLECVGSVDSGLTGMQWSPDLELLVLTTGAEKVLLMSREFDPITEVPLYSAEFGEDDFVSVGWGKKETQFHGSEGKQAARRQKEAIQSADPCDDRRPRIQWRGDGQFFSISAINPATSARYIRVWARDCVLQSTSELMNGLGQALSWKPSGALIASTQKKPNKYDVVFFERNGLQHGEFTLRSGGKEAFKVVELMWNMDSSVLAVWYETHSSLDDSSVGDTVPTSWVQLWTCSNYYWSLKQTLNFDTQHGCVTSLTWDPEQAGRLHIVTSQGHYFQYNWIWITNHSMGLTSRDPANVFVIDGSTLKVTPMRQIVVPPPMSAYQLELSAAASQVVSPASPPEATGGIGVLTHNNTFLIFKNIETGGEKNSLSKLDAAGGDGFTPQYTISSLQASYRLMLPESVSEFPLCITHICWPRADTLVLCVQGNRVFLAAVRFPPGQTDDCLQLEKPVQVEDEVLSLSLNPTKAAQIAVQLASGSVLRFNIDDESLVPWETAEGKEVCFPMPCYQMEVTTFKGEEAVLGLTERFRFYVNGIEVASNCTSFAVHDEFLLLTTLNHTLRCIHRHMPVKVLSGLSDGKAHPFDESIRRVERGSRIVAVVAQDTKVVLQMPRGNLETIYPRALVLAAVRHHLDNLNFDSAFTLMKKHRINLNLLCDHNHSDFLKNIDQFIDQVSNVTNINLFLTELQEEDVTMTMYTAAYDRPAALPTGSLSLSYARTSKVDRVCDAVHSALEKCGADKYRLAILTILVKKSKPELPKALEMIWHLKGKETEGVSAEDALKFLMFLVDVNSLYDAALATYNFDLMLMVAEKSQKDPKEYIPFLNQLRRLEENYCHYTIDRHLKNYSSALKHIALCGAERFSECLTLVQEQKLYVEALKLFDTGSQAFKTLAKEYGLYLREKNRHDEAGIAFIRAEEWQEAYDAFVYIGNWRQAICMATQLQFDQTRIAEMARIMAVRLRETRKFAEAAVLFEQYAQDVEEAIVTLIEGALWEDALRLMYTHKRTDIIETHLKSAIGESCQDLLGMLENQQKDMEGYTDRLIVVREGKAWKRQQLWANNPDHLNSDLFSDTSSVTGESVTASQCSFDSNRSTVFSKASGRSNRNRKKAEHKKWSLKQGSPFEDCALVDAIAKIILATDNMRNEVSALLHVLTQFHQVEAAEELQTKYGDVLATIQRIVPVVWKQDQLASDTNAAYGPGTTSNSIAQAAQHNQMTETGEKIDPVLLVPPPLKRDVRWKLHMLQTSER